jgi:hypothetical protein
MLARLIDIQKFKEIMLHPLCDPDEKADEKVDERQILEHLVFRVLICRASIRYNPWTFRKIKPK